MELSSENPAISDETRALIALRMVPGIGPKLTAALIERFGSARLALQASAQDLLDVPQIGDELAQRLRQSMARNDADEEFALMKQHDVNVVVAGEPGYPPALGQIAGPPVLLYVAGQILPQDEKAIAIVGSRSCSSYGRRVAERMAGDFARLGITVVSGLARGIDACAHRGALNSKGRTLAVLAGGLCKIYPPEHADLAKEVKANGALISESSMRMEPMAGMFPARNRIISGMCQAVVVVEAAEKSGALITAVHAAEQGREVFAVPGQVDSPHSGGTLQLLRQGAKLARHAGDVLEDLDWHGKGQGHGPAAATVPSGLSELEAKVWEFLGEQARTIDEIAQNLAKPIAELTGTLMTLELKKIIRRQPGNVYERI